MGKDHTATIEVELGVLQGFLQNPVLGGESKLMQMYGNFEGFPPKECVVWVGNLIK